MQNPQSTIQQLYDNQGMLDILIAIEKYFEDNDLYAYKDIQSGEIVEGPNIEKYWVEIVLKYYRENFPDPAAFKILERHGTKVKVKGDYEIRPIEHPRSRRDMEQVPAQNGTVSMPKEERVPVLLVRVQIPRSVINPESFDEYKLSIAELNKSQIQDVSEFESDVEQDAPMSDDEQSNAGGM